MRDGGREKRECERDGGETEKKGERGARGSPRRWGEEWEGGRRNTERERERRTARPHTARAKLQRGSLPREERAKRKKKGDGRGEAGVGARDAR